MQIIRVQIGSAGVVTALYLRQGGVEADITWSRKRAVRLESDHAEVVIEALQKEYPEGKFWAEAELGSNFGVFPPWLASN